MSGTCTIIEILSGRKLAVLITILLLCQLLCFLIGGLIVPIPANVQRILATACEDSSAVKNDTTKWFFNQSKVSSTSDDLENWFSNTSKTDIVFAFQMPVPRGNKLLKYSRWQQKLIGLLQIDIANHSQMDKKIQSIVTTDARLAYRNKEDPEDEWNLYSQSVEKRHLDCDIDPKTEANLYNCSEIPLFELGSLFHDYYLLNLRLSVDSPDMNNNLGIQNLWLTVFNQNEEFTKVWVSLKTVFFSCIMGILIWFAQRLKRLERKPVLLEKMLLSLGIGMCILNIPLEYLTLYFNLKFMLLMGDLRQGVFYAKLFSFWLVFTCEHMVIRETLTQSSIKLYWRHLCAIAIGSISLFVLDMGKRGVKLRNPFYSIWVTDVGTNLVLPFIIVAGIFLGVYYQFLCYSVLKVLKNISHQRQYVPTSAMCEKTTVRYLDYESIVYRFKIVMLMTLLCAALTIIGIILGQLTEGQWKWGEYIELEYTSAFFTGVYGMWNIYIFALLVLYAPSNMALLMNKTYLNQNITQNKDHESILLNK